LNVSNQQAVEAFFPVILLVAPSRKGFGLKLLIARKANKTCRKKCSLLNSEQKQLQACPEAKSVRHMEGLATVEFTEPGPKQSGARNTPTPCPFRAWGHAQKEMIYKLLKGSFSSYLWVLFIIEKLQQ
jgi:hypothetical protein